MSQNLLLNQPKGDTPSQGPARRGALARRPVIAHPVAVACLAGVALVYGLPLALALASVTPGPWNEPDVAVTVWNAWWLGQGLAGSAEVLRTTAILAPLGADLTLHAFGPLFSLVALPFVPWLGYVGAVNVAVLVTLFLNGAVVYWLLNREIRQSAAALGAAFLMVAVPVTSELFGGRAAAASLWTVAAALGSAGSLMDRPRVWNVMGLALALVAALLSDLQLFLSALVWLAIYLAGRIVRAGRMSLGASRLKALGISLVAGLLPFVVIYVPALWRGPARGYPLPSVEDLTAESFRLADYMDLRLIQLEFGYEFLAAVVLTLFLFGRRAEYRVWLGGALVFLVLALGPSLQTTSIPLPPALATTVPLLALIDAPRRFMLPALLGMTGVAAFLCARVFHRLPSRGAVAPMAFA